MQVKQLPTQSYQYNAPEALMSPSICHWKFSNVTYDRDLVSYSPHSFDDAILHISSELITLRLVCRPFTPHKEPDASKVK